MTVRDLKDYLSLGVVPDDALVQVMEDSARGGEIDAIDVGYAYTPTTHGRNRVLVIRVPTSSLNARFTSPGGVH